MRDKALAEWQLCLEIEISLSLPPQWYLSTCCCRKEAKSKAYDGISLSFCHSQPSHTCTQPGFSSAHQAPFNFLTIPTAKLAQQKLLFLGTFFPLTEEFIDLVAKS